MGVGDEGGKEEEEKKNSLVRVRIIWYTLKKCYLGIQVFRLMHLPEGVSFFFLNLLEDEGTHGRISGYIDAWIDD